MKRLLVVVVPLAAVALVLAVSASAGAKKDRHANRHGTVISVVEHASTDATTDTGAPGDTAGDILTFANDLYDARDAKVVGTDQGSCIRIVVGKSYECTWTNIFPKGQIVVSGVFYDAKGSTLAITGGTGRYKDARGTMDLVARENGTKFSFVFHLVR
jgi:Ni/Co efflux regulator RcnB